jgi:hypothetical protein
MKTAEFTQVAEKLIGTGLFNVVEKGEHGKTRLGRTAIGRTDRQNTSLWRKFGTVENIIIFKTAEEANEILKTYGITEFQARNTKSKTMCRLVEVK